MPQDGASRFTIDWNAYSALCLVASGKRELDAREQKFQKNKDNLEAEIKAKDEHIAELTEKFNAVSKSLESAEIQLEELKRQSSVHNKDCHARQEWFNSQVEKAQIATANGSLPRGGLLAFLHVRYHELREFEPTKADAFGMKNGLFEEKRSHKGSRITNTPESGSRNNEERPSKLPKTMGGKEAFGSFQF